MLHFKFKSGLIFLAIYQRLSDLQKTLNNQNPTEAAQLEDIITLKSNIKRKLMYDGKPRLTLLHRDAEVYESFLAIINKEEPKKYGSRAFAKRYKSILGLLNDPEGIHSIEDIKSFYDRLNAAEMLRISVGDTADAFAVFSSLNSKGVPLTLIDLLKTEYLQRATQAGMTTDGAQSKWEELTDIFTGEGNEPNSTAITQFLLNNYDALVSGSLSSITKRQALRLYLKEFNDKGASYMDQLIGNAKMFSHISPLLDPDPTITLPDAVESELCSLKKLDPTQAYPLMIVMLKAFHEDKIEVTCVEDTLKYLINFYVRRNIVSWPKASNIRAKTIEISHLMRDTGHWDDLSEKVKTILGSIASSDKQFSLALDSGVYDVSPATVRFMLIAFEREHDHFFNKQNPDNLDQVKGTGSGRKLPIWSIEHIMPETQNLKNGWPEMISPEAPDDVADVQQAYLHKIGNLTLTGYNAEMSDHSFTDKVNYRSTEKADYSGLRTPLALNESILNAEKGETWDSKTSWTTEDIDRRNEFLKGDLIKLFAI